MSKIDISLNEVLTVAIGATIALTVFWVLDKKVMPKILPSWYGLPSSEPVGE